VRTWQDQTHPGRQAVDDHIQEAPDSSARGEQPDGNGDVGNGRHLGFQISDLGEDDFRTTAQAVY
jgi:hypothetical protein